MISLIIYATGDPDLLGDTIRRTFGTDSTDLEVIVGGDIGTVPARLGCDRRADHVRWISRSAVNRDAAATSSDGMRRD